MSNDHVKALRYEGEVLVIGAGITGLTVAHELIDRGFRVTVVERLPKPFDAGDCEVGGVARTQWVSLVNAIQEYGFQEPQMSEADASFSHEPSGALGSALMVRIVFAYGSCAFTKDAKTHLDTIAEQVRAYLTQRDPKHARLVTVEGHFSCEEADLTDYELWRATSTVAESDVQARDYIYELLQDEPRSRALAYARAYAVASELKGRIDPSGEKIIFIPVGMPKPVKGRLAKTDEKKGAWVSYRLYETPVPGEHGYRYFPSFYRHVFDTMRRIPLFEPNVLKKADTTRQSDAAHYFRANYQIEHRGVPEDVESSRTVYDNLVPTFEFSIARGDNGRLDRIPRSRPRSIRELLQLVRYSLETLNVDVRDLARLQIKLAQYLTSSKERRKQYEEMTWWQFLKAEQLTEPTQELIEQWPQALIGIRARLADARTIGTVTIQLLLNQLTTTGLRDATLNGPSSKAWFDPWRTFLRYRGVQFWRKELEKLEYEGDKVVPKWRGQENTTNDKYDYIVLATPLLEAKSLVSTLAQAKPNRTLNAPLQALLSWDFNPSPPPTTGLPFPSTVAQAEESPLRHYSGIQFYFWNDFGPPQGHIYFRKTPWRLSAIVQSQFWSERTYRRAPEALSPDNPQAVPSYLSVLSVDIGDWYAPGKDGKTAATCTKKELAEETLRQIREHLSPNAAKFPTPYAYHVDDEILYDSTTKKPKANYAPYQVNLAGDWKKRPVICAEGNASDIHCGLVLAGTYTATNTRLVTMEAANESGRRAVNAILKKVVEEKGRDEEANLPVRIWDPEDDEIDDLEMLKEIDKKLCEQGLPHFLEILDADAWLSTMGVPDLTPDGILDAVLRHHRLTTDTFAASLGLPLASIRQLLTLLFGPGR